VIGTPRLAVAGIAAGVAGAALFALARFHPAVVEAVYSKGIYPWIARPLAAVSGLVPLSFAEIGFVLLALLLVAVPAAAWLHARRRLQRGRAGAFRAAAAWTAGLAGWTWLLFLLVWGLNYARQPVERAFALGAPPDPVQTQRWAAAVGARLDRLRAGLEEDERGVVARPGDLPELDREIARLQAAVLEARGLPAVGGGRTKSFLLSPLLVRWRVSGVYGPFTGEPNVVLPAAPGLLPFVVAHERAHLAGVAQEDEASYVAMVTLWASQEPRLRYSAWLELWLHLGRSARGRHPGVVRDLRAISEFSRRHVGWERPLVSGAYDVYLRSHGVPGGTRSYGRVAGLALRHLETFGIPDLPRSLRRPRVLADRTSRRP
jgi:hypothetical protein